MLDLTSRLRDFRIKLGGNLVMLDVEAADAELWTRYLSLPAVCEGFIAAAGRGVVVGRAVLGYATLLLVAALAVDVIFAPLHSF